MTAELMDHRDVVDAARALVDAGGYVKFSLPPGAFLGGLYHLGGGVFVGKLPNPLDDARRPPRMLPPHEVWALAGDKALMDAQAPVISLELCDNPLPSSAAGAFEYRRAVPTRLVVKMTDPKTNERVWRAVDSGKVIKRRPAKR